MKNVISWLIFILTCTALAVFRWAQTPDGWTEWVQWELAWPFSLLVTAAFLFHGTYIYRNKIKTIERESRWLITLIPFFAIIHLLEPHFLKVSFDEQAHLGVSYGMFKEGRCELPLAAHLNFPYSPSIDVYGTTFRGYYFSSLVAAVARAVGFSENLAYWVNGFIALGTLFTVYALSRRIGIKPHLAPIPAILLLGTTIFGQVMCSGSYDMTNLLCLSLLLLLLVQFLETKSKADERQLLLIALLLSYCRTESILYYGTTVAAILIVRKSRPSLGILLSLPFTLPMLATQKVLMANPNNLTQGAIQPGQEVWSLGNLFENWQDTIVYLLNQSPAKMGSLLLFILGTAGLTLITLRTARGKLQPSKREVAILLTACTAVSLYSMVMGSFWGGPSIKLMMTRFTLPLWLLLSIGAAYTIKFTANKALVTPGKIWMAIITWFIICVMPSHVKKDALSSFDHSLADKKMIELAKSVDDGRTLFVYESCPSFVSRQLPCVEYGFFINNLPSYIKLAKMGTWSKIVFVELIKLKTPSAEIIEYNPKWSKSREILETKEIAHLDYDASWRLCTSEWIGLKQGQNKISLYDRTNSFPEHSDHNDLMIRLRQLLPRDPNPKTVP